jgi:hypothetical protein
LPDRHPTRGDRLRIAGVRVVTPSSPAKETGDSTTV